MVVAAIGETTNDAAPGSHLPQSDGALFLDLRVRRKILKGQHVAGRQATTESGSAAPVSSQKACSTGTQLFGRRLSATTTMSGRPAAFCSRTSSSALAVGVSPETRIRPAPSLRWEATREKAGNFSTSVKRSRTNGRTIASLILTGSKADSPERGGAIERPQILLRRALVATHECGRSRLLARKRGRVRQVGPPLPLIQSSEPGKCRTSNPASRKLLVGLSSFPPGPAGASRPAKARCRPASRVRNSRSR